MLNNGLNWLEQKLNDFCSSEVQYRRSDDIKNIPAVFGKTDYELSDEYGFSLGAFIWDFLIDVSLLGFEPQVGDQIIVNGQIFGVMNLSSQGCWQWTGPNRKTYRIHTKEL
ncbi:MAG: hypothetical protein JEZ07_08915 [Phycisphaerae bacterium]|nr:hypothetical protein [Phycisphaerae bacterium]